MNFNYILVGKKIKEIRKHKHLSQLSLAEKADKSPTFISLMESGVKGMSLATFVDLANALEVTADILLAEQISNNLQAYGQELAVLLSDCGDYERAVIMELVRTAKKAMRDNKYKFGS